MEITVLHTSDWQCGRPFRPWAADAMLDFAERLRPTVVVSSGDLTQRAKKREFRLAVELLGRFGDVPTVTCPGNHDVPLFRAGERIVDPFRNWRRFVAPTLDRVVEADGIVAVALCSAAPRRALVNGRLTDGQLDFAGRQLAAAPDGAVRCLVVHHHFVPAPDGEGGRVLPRGERWLAAIEAAGVDFVLGGHVHQTHISNSRDVLTSGAGPGVPLIACGTTTSFRGRGAERGLNSLNVVRVTEDEILVTPHILEGKGGAFEPRETQRLPRPTRPATDPVAAREGTR